MTPKKRIPIPAKVQADVVFSSDLLCCVCGRRGHHIHHIDGNPANNLTSNLVLLCVDCHDRATRRSNLVQDLTPELLSRYRAVHYRKIESQRAFLLANTNQSDEGLFQVTLDAVLVSEIAKVHRSLRNAGWEESENLIYQLTLPPNVTAVHARQAVVEALSSVATKTRLGMPGSVGQAISYVADETLFFRGLREPVPGGLLAPEREILIYGADIGLGLAYDGALYVHNIELVYLGSELLSTLLYYANLNKANDVVKSVLEAFDTALDGAKRSEDAEALQLVTISKKAGFSKRWRPPEYPDNIADRILSAFREPANLDHKSPS